MNWQYRAYVVVCHYGFSCKIIELEAETSKLLDDKIQKVKSKYPNKKITVRKTNVS